MLAPTGSGELRIQADRPKGTASRANLKMRGLEGIPDCDNNTHVPFHHNCHMKTFILTSAALVAATSITYAGAIVAESGTTILAGWTFDAVTTTNTGTAPIFSAGSSTADLGVQTAGSAASALHASASTVWSNPSGNGSLKSISSNNWAVGDYYQFTLSTTGFDGIWVGFSQVGSSTGPRDFKLAYSTDGTNFTDFATYTSVLSDWTTSLVRTSGAQVFNLSAITALDNQPAVTIRLIDTSTTSIGGGTVAAAGTGRVDDFTVADGQLNIVPEPSTTLTVLCGAGMLGLLRRRTARA